MTLRLIPNVYQMLFAKKYAQKQVAALYKKKSDQLRESAIGINELFTSQLKAVSKGFMKIGEKQQKVNDMFGIKPAKIIVYYYKNTGSGAEDNSAKVLFLNSFAELLLLMKNEKFQKVDEFSYFFYENKVRTPSDMSVIYSLKSHKESEEKNWPETILKQYKEGKGRMYEDKNEYLKKSTLIDKLDQLTEYYNQKSITVHHPLNKKLFASYFRLTRENEFLDIFISKTDVNMAVPKEQIIIKNVSKDVKLTPELYNKEYQEELGKIKSEELETQYLMTFIGAFNKLLSSIDIDIKDTSVIYEKRKEKKKVLMKAKSTASFFKKEENKIKVVEDLKSRTRKLIYSQWEIKRIKKKDITLLSVGQTVIKRLRNYKAVFKKSDNAFSIFNSVLLELEQGDVWKLNPLTNIVEVNPEKEITLGKELSFFTEEKTTDILKYAKERVIIENKEVEEKNKNPLFGNIIQLITEEEFVRREKKKNSIIDKIRNAWDKDKHTYLGEVGEMAYKQNAIMRIWNKNTDDRTIEQTRALQEILYDVSKYFGLTLFLQSSEIWKQK